MTGKYLDPKADLTFKLIFEHEDLLISLLNALLPLDEGKQIEHVEYLPAELVPRIPARRIAWSMCAAARLADATSLLRCS